MNEVEDASSIPRRGGRKRGLRTFLIALFCFVIVLLLIAGGSAGYIIKNLKPVEAKEKAVVVTIPSGSSTGDIAGILKKNGLIRNERLFTYYVRYKKVGNTLQAGTYEITPGMTIDSMLNKLAKGDVQKKATVKFTIPEGFKVEQIAAKLEAEGVVDKASFMNEVENGQFAYEFLKSIPPNDKRKNRLEGFLFPKTYEIPKDELNAHAIVDRMLSQFEKEFKPEYSEALKEQKLNFYDAIILASIVERESTVDHERPRIAGVLNNRLAIDMALQMDSTLQYIFNQQKEIVTYDDLEIDDPYNTYKYRGLPPGPVSNPGIASLEAVVYPEKNKYLYFVTKKDGSGEHYFAETFDEHVKNRRLSERASQK